MFRKLRTCSVHLYTDLKNVILVAKKIAPDFYTASPI